MTTRHRGTPTPGTLPVLERLVGDADAFLRHWEHTPVVAAAGPAVREAFPLEAALSLLDRPGLPASCFRVFQQGAPLARERFATARGRPGRGREEVADRAALLRAHDAGATIVFEEVRLLVPEVERLASALERELGFGVYCAAFLTPAGNSGVRPHYDLASGFLCQVHGSKSWSVGAPETPWPTVPSADTQPEFEPVLETVLTPGRTLYIPRGHPHAGAATDELSLHLSFAVVPRTWRDVLLSHLRGGGGHEALREMLPLGHADLDDRHLLERAVERLTREVGPRG
ncbi:cupin domain-containing protein [Nocardiopsis sp. NPDC007018]|uniref:JmjC domain-containing protein n=1 Tax=Nocardiopsis sp. NPDC007018 TaxID=3155721 RepID=UPI0033FEFEDE